MTIGLDLIPFRSYQGTEVFTENILFSLIDLETKHRFVVFKGVDQFIFLDKLVKQEKRLQDHLFIVNFSYFRSSIGIVFTQQIILPFLVLKYKVGLLYSFSPFFSFLSVCKKINTIHDAAYKRFNEFRNLFSRFYITLSIGLSSLCTHTVTCSYFSKQELIKFYKFDARRVSVIEAALPVLPKVDRNHSMGVLQKFGLLGDDYLFYVGNFSMRKNVQRIVEAYAYYLKLNPGSRLLLVLAGSYSRLPRSLEEFLFSTELTGKVILPGFITNFEKSVLYRHAKIFLFPSLYEGFGMPILEAQSVGVPVITSSVASMPEVAGMGAVLVDPENLDEITAAIGLICSSQNAKEELIHHGLQNVSRFSWEKSTRKLLELFEDNL